MARERREPSTWEPVPYATAENVGPAGTLRPATGSYRIVRVGRLRVPIAGPYQPWATLYRLPDGRELWCLRLWDEGGPVRRVVTTSTLLSYARRSRLRELEAEILDLREHRP